MDNYSQKPYKESYVTAKDFAPQIDVPALNMALHNLEQCKKSGSAYGRNGKPAIPPDHYRTEFYYDAWMKSYNEAKNRG